MAKPYIGGQAVLEGVTMISPDKMAIAVRRAKDKQIIVHVKEVTQPSKKHKVLGWPIIRGIVNFINTLKTGMNTITESAEMLGDEEAEEEPSRFEKWLAEKLGKRVDDVVVGVAVVVAIVLACLMFVVAPSLVASWLKTIIASRTVVNLLEGLVRLMIFMGYMIAVTKVKEIGRVFRYHGAEHKTVHAWEHDDELTVENVRKYSTMHPRCGTAFLLIVMLLSILLFSVFGWDATWYTRILSRLALFPIVAGVSYEVLRIFGRYDNKLVRVLRWPGMMLQNLTAKEPDDGMMEVAIVAMKAAAGLPYEDMVANDEMEEEDVAEVAGEGFTSELGNEDEPAVGS